MTECTVAFLETVPYASHLSDPQQDLDEEYYVRHRIETVQRIKLTARTDALALAAMVDEDYDCARLWGDYTAVEMGHDVLFLRDLERHGHDRASVDATEPFPATRAMIAWIEEESGELGSLPALAYSVFVEWSSERYSMNAVVAAKAKFGAESVAGSEEHVGIDEDESHYRMLLGIAQHLAGQRPDVFLRLLRRVGAFFCDYFRQLHAATIGRRGAAAFTPEIVTWPRPSPGRLDRANLVYLTSSRWVDGSGQGTLESLARQIASGVGEFGERFNLVGVVVDDDGDEYAAAWSGGDLWPPRLVVPIAVAGVTERVTLEQLTLRLSSADWRRSPRRGAAREERAALKRDYERRLGDFLDLVGADLLLCESYLPMIGPELLERFSERILNVHPAVTEVGDPARLPGRHPTRDTFTRAAFGFVVVDDKPDGLAPAGPEITVELEGATRRAVRVPALRECAVTVHVATEAVDAGPVVACRRHPLRDDEVSMPAIRAVNRTIKAAIVPHALVRHTARAEVREAILQRRAALRGATA